MRLGIYHNYFIYNSLFLLIFYIPNIAFAKDVATKTTIKAEIIKIVKDKNFVEFKNNVILSQNDISFLSDQMLVFTDKNKKISEKFEIKLVKANGRVKIFNQEFIATGDFGIYDIDKNTFKIFGDVILNEGTKIAYGNEFTYDIEEKNGFLTSFDVKKGKNKRPTVIINEDLDNLKKQIDANSNN